MAASLVCRRSSSVCKRLATLSRPLCVSAARQTELEPTTHTGQKFNREDYRKARFINKEKLVNQRFAIDLIAEDPIVVSDQRVVWSNSGGALGHPKVFINLDQPGVHTCGYSGRKFVHKKFYDEKSMGPSITHEEYLKEVS